MHSEILKHSLYRMANPRSIAFFGASNNISSMGSNQLASLLALGFEGAIYPVHPKERRIQGLQAYQEVDDLPEVPDLAILVLPTKIVADILAACGRKGIRHAIVVSGGFREIGPEGLQREKQIAEVVHRYGMRLLGPNCIGIANPHHKFNCTFLEFEGQPGFVGMASQSGSFITQMFNLLARRGLGFSTAFSVGNEADVDLVDCLEYLGACPRTRVIALYIEGIRRGRAFVETARAVATRKPVVAFYVGGSETGQRAGLSHTGAMAGPDALYEGMFRQCGILRARSVTEMFDLCHALGALPAPGGRGVVIQTHSGGPGAAAADACGREGLQLPDLSSSTREALSRFVPLTSSLNNPVDLTYMKNPLDYFSSIPGRILQDPRTDMLLIYVLMPGQTIRRALKHMGLSEEEIQNQSAQLLEQQCRALAALLERFQKPVAGYTFRSLQDPFTRSLLEMGIPVFSDADRAARALRALHRYAEWQKAGNAAPPT